MSPKTPENRRKLQYRSMSQKFYPSLIKHLDLVAEGRPTAISPRHRNEKLSQSASNTPRKLSPTSSSGNLLNVGKNESGAQSEGATPQTSPRQHHRPLRRSATMGFGSPLKAVLRATKSSYKIRYVDKAIYFSLYICKIDSGY